MTTRFSTVYGDRRAFRRCRGYAGASKGRRARQRRVGLGCCARRRPGGKDRPRIRIPVNFLRPEVFFDVPVLGYGQAGRTARSLIDTTGSASGEAAADGWTIHRRP